MAECGPSGGTALAFYLPKEDAFIVAADQMVTRRTVKVLAKNKSDVETHKETSAQKVYCIDETIGCAVIGLREEATQWINSLSGKVTVDDKFIKEKSDGKGKKKVNTYAKKTNVFQNVVGYLESHRIEADLKNKDKVDILLTGWDAKMKPQFVHMSNTGYVDKVNAWCIGTGRVYAMTFLESEPVKDMDIQEGVEFAQKAIYAASTIDYKRTGDSVDVLIVRPNSVRKLDSVPITTLKTKHGEDPLKLEQKYASSSSSS